MPSLGFDLRRVFTEADLTLFADVPELVPTDAASPSGRYEYLGPIIWSPAAPVPECLTDSADARPLVYVSMGSSGDASALGVVVDAVVACGCRVGVAAPGGGWTHTHGDRVFVGEMLPGSELASLASLVICNGGSPGVHQSLQQGTPVLGIPGNLDQLLNMHFVAKTGAGLSLRADQLTPSAVRRDVQRLLQEDDFRRRAEQVRGWFTAYCAEDRFRNIVARVLSGCG